jgi:hypothetical protein
MKFGNLYIWGCLLSLLMGASAVSPLLFTAYVAPENEVRVNPQSSTANIGANVAYAYIVLENTTLPAMPGSSDAPASGQAIKFVFVLNSTKYLNSLEQIPDAEIDYFVIQLHTNEGSINNLTESVGAAYTTFTKEEMHSNPMNTFSFFRQDWMDLRASGGGSFWLNWTTGTSRLSGGGSNSGSTNLRQAPLLENAQTVTLSLSRLGEVIFTGNSTVVSKADAGLIEQIDLKKYGNGFLYNTIIPDYMLALMDPLHPIY